MNNLGYFISSKLTKSGHTKFSRTSYSIGIITVVLGISILLIFSMTLKGMQKSISDRMFGISGHITLMKYSFDIDNQYPINIDKFDTEYLDKNPNIKFYYPFIYKIGLIKNKQITQGMLFKGVGVSKDISKRFGEYIISGQFMDKDNSDGVLISKKIAQKLKLKVGDRFLTYFLSDRPRFKKLTVTGIYSTDIPDLDEKVIVCNISMMHMINDWQPVYASGIDIVSADINIIDALKYDIKKHYDRSIRVRTLKEQFLSLFNWLIILNTNKLILFILILVVVSFNMIGIILILMIERTFLTGILKTLGAANSLISKIFFFSAAEILWKGLIIGNVISLLLCYIQDRFKVIKLNPDEIYIKYIMIHWDIKDILFLNGLFALVVLFTNALFIMVMTRSNLLRQIKFS